MNARSLKEVVPPLIPLITGLFILANACFDAYTGKMHMRGGGDIFRSANPKGFRSRLILEFAIALALIALWVWEISN